MTQDGKLTQKTARGSPLSRAVSIRMGSGVMAQVHGAGGEIDRAIEWLALAAIDSMG